MNGSMAASPGYLVATSAARMGANAIVPSPGPRRFGSLKWMWPMRPVGTQRRTRVGDGDRFRLTGRRAVDHGAHSWVVDGAHDRGSLLHGVDELGLVARQRFDAVGNARLRRRFGNRGKTIDASLAPVVLFAGGERALIGRAMDQDAGTEIGGQPAQC